MKNEIALNVQLYQFEYTESSLYRGRLRSSLSKVE